MRKRFFWICLMRALAVHAENTASAVEAKRPMSVAGKPSGPPRTQEFNSGVQLMTTCLKGPSGPPVTFLPNRWPADAIVFYGRQPTPSTFSKNGCE